MHQILAILCVLSFLLSACQKNEKQNEKYLSEEKMIDVLTDIQWLKAYQMRSRFNQSYEDSLHRALLQKHQINQTDLDSNLSFYSKDAKRLEKMYEIIIQKLEEKKLESQ